MLDALNITEAEAEGLTELAAHDLAMARDFARRAQAAEDADAANRYARSYQRAARSYRQTLALKARLRRDLAQADAMADAACAAGPPPKVGGAAVARRLGELRTALLRLAWDEAERPETEGEEIDLADAAETFALHRDGIDDVVAEDALTPGFGAEPLDDHVARVGLRLGFTPAAIARWPDLPEPPKAALEAVFEPDWESSA